MEHLRDTSDAEGVEMLDEVECLDLLRQSGLGRVAVSIGAVPAVFPVNFALIEEGIVFRTATGTKLDAATRNSVVAFEVDEDPLLDEGWSVLAVGMADELRDPVLIGRAERLLLSPSGDAQRDHLVVVNPTFISGQRIAKPEHMAAAVAQATGAV